MRPTRRLVNFFLARAGFLCPNRLESLTLVLIMQKNISNLNPIPHSCRCDCCARGRNPKLAEGAVNRRDFLFRVGAATAATGFGLSALESLGAETAEFNEPRPEAEQGAEGAAGAHLCPA